MSESTLIVAIKEKLEEWEGILAFYRLHEDPRYFELDERIDDLKGILPPEDE